MLLNCAKNLVNGPRFLPSGKRFGPYCWSRAEDSGRLRPFSELVTSRLTTSACDMACQAATSLSVFVFTVVLMDATPLRRLLLLGEFGEGARLLLNNCKVRFGQLTKGFDSFRAI